MFLQQFALLTDFDLSDLGEAERLHTVIECAKLAFADREAWYGDPAFVDVPLAELLSPAYTRERRALVGDEASCVLRPGSPDGREPGCATGRRARGRRRRPGGSDTCAL